MMDSDNPPRPVITETTFEIDEWLSLNDLDLSSCLNDYYSAPLWSAGEMMGHISQNSSSGTSNSSLDQLESGYQAPAMSAKIKAVSSVKHLAGKTTSSPQWLDGTEHTNIVGNRPNTDEPGHVYRVCPTCSQELPPDLDLGQMSDLPAAIPPRRKSHLSTEPRSFSCSVEGCVAAFGDSRSLARHRSCVHEAPITLPCGATRKNRRDNILRHIRKCSKCSRARRHELAAERWSLLLGEYDGLGFSFGDMKRPQEAKSSDEQISMIASGTDLLSCLRTLLSRQILFLTHRMILNCPLSLEVRWY